MAARSFVIGVVVGGLLVAGPVFLLDADGEPRTTRQPSEARPAADEHSDSRDLLDELARLRAQLDEARRLADRVPVEANFRPAQGRAAADSASESAAVETVPPDLRLVAMLEELRGMLNSGALATRFADEYEELAGYLIGIWLELDEPRQAFDLIERSGLRSEFGTWGEWIGGQLLEEGDRDRARDAFLMALEHDPADWDVLRELADLAPELALREHTRFAAEIGTPSDESGFRAQQALLMLASGRHDSALKLIDALIASGEMPDTLWWNLVRRDPIAAEDRLHARIENAAAGTDQSEIRLQFASALRNQGRTTEARREIDRLLQEYPDHFAVITALSELDRGRAIEHLRERVRANPSGAIWALYGSQLSSAGHSEAATDAYYRAWQIAPGEGYEYYLLQLDPERFAPELAQRAQANNDDELCGDIADALWQVGRREVARTYWQRAHEIDRSDSEWSFKLRELAAGRDPVR